MGKTLEEHKREHAEYIATRQKQRYAQDMERALALAWDGGGKPEMAHVCVNGEWIEAALTAQTKAR
jgi:hypothetical protein